MVGGGHAPSLGVISLGMAYHSLPDLAHLAVVVAKAVAAVTAATMPWSGIVNMLHPTNGIAVRPQVHV